MSLKQFLKSARVGIMVALIVLVVGVAGEIAWLAFGLPGVHRTTVTPASRVPATVASMDSANFSVRTVSESYTDISIAPTFVLSGVGLVVGFWWAYRRGQSGGTP